MDSYEKKSFKGLHVLVVNANLIDQRLISHLLLQWDVLADVTANGRDALEMVSTDIYDLVLMGLMMPELDGYETTRAIRAMGGNYFGHLPVYALSCNPDNARLTECGFTGSLSGLPLFKEELQELLLQFMTVHS
ncbi:MAG: response regulator [Bacteroidota bacterium]